MPPPLIDTMVADAVTDADVLIIEGAMGLFDGVPSDVRPLGRSSRSGRALWIAGAAGARRRRPVPVRRSCCARLCVIPIRRFQIGGVILNRLGSERHRTLVADALKRIGIPILGAVPRDDSLLLPERHLGLVQAREHPDLADRLDRLAAMAERNLDLDGIVRMARPIGADARVQRRALASARSTDCACTR